MLSVFVGSLEHRWSTGLESDVLSPFCGTSCEPRIQTSCITIYVNLVGRSTQQRRSSSMAQAAMGLTQLASFFLRPCFISAQKVVQIDTKDSDKCVLSSCSALRPTHYSVCTGRDSCGRAKTTPYLGRWQSTMQEEELAISVFRT